jgi:FKBP-type peptidyl-prolyl cis-trans isomerase
MTSKMLKHAASALITPALLISTAPSFAATPTAAKAKPPVLTCETAGADGLTYTVIKSGKGDKPSADSKVKVNYKGMLTSDGSKFDEGQGAEFKVGGVIPGFAQGLQLMQPGGSYRLCIPSKLGYGEAGTGPPKPVVPLTERTCDQTTASALGYRAIKTGTGKTPTDADMTLVDFTTFDAKTGITLEKREWEKIPVAQATAIFAEGLKMMQVGSSYTFCLPKAAETAGQPEINIRVDLLDVRIAPATD